MSINLCLAAEISIKNILQNKLIAVPKGTMADILVLNAIPNASIAYYNDTQACLEALHNSEVDAAAYDEPVVRSILRHYPNLKILPEYVTNDNYGLAVNLKQTELKKVIDGFIREFRASGKLAAMREYWFAAANEPVMPQIKLTGEKVLRFGTSSVVEPFTYKNYHVGQPNDL